LTSGLVITNIANNKNNQKKAIEYRRKNVKECRLISTIIIALGEKSRVFDE